jgi:O-antigen/teichoic acid export membrane protein
VATVRLGGMLSRSFLRTGTAVAVGNGVIALVGVLALRIYTELAPAEVFGAANLALTAMGLAFQLFIHPIVATQLRYQTEATQAGHGDRFAAEAFRWGLAVSIGVAVLAVIGFAAYSIVANARIGSPMLVAAAGWIVIVTCRHMLMARLHAEQQMMSYMTLRVGEAALIVLVTACALKIAPWPESFVWGQALASGTVVAGIFVLSPWSIFRLMRAGTMPGFLKKIWRYGVPFVPMALLLWLANLADRYVLGGLIGAAAVGQYLAAFTIASSGFGLTNGALTDLFRPMLFDAENAQDQGRARRVFLSWLATYVAISFCGLAVILLVGHWIVDLVLAEAYRSGAVEIMLWIALGYAINGLTMALENRIFSLGHSARVLWPLAAGAVGNIVLSCILVTWHGTVGAAQASCLSFGLQFVLTAITLHRALGSRH